MQPSSTRFFGCLWKRTNVQQLMMMHQLQWHKIATRQLSSKGGNWGDRMAARNMSQRPSHPIVRETNMWKDPQCLDTKWLSPRDPRRYRPDFAQTEPHTLRKQFMRSPDERTRDAMNRDWESSVQYNKTSRLQAQVVAQQRNQDKMSLYSSKSGNQKSQRSTHKKRRHQLAGKRRVDDGDETNED